MRAPEKDYTESDLLEFFGNTYEEILHPLGGRDNQAVHQLVFSRSTPPTDEYLAMELYRDRAVAASLFDGRGPGWFGRFFGEHVPRIAAESDIFSFLREHPVPLSGNVLDFGAGHGETSLVLWSLGYDGVTWADIPHDWFKFMRWACTRAEVGIRFLPIWPAMKFSQDDKRYDLIVSNEVKEHCFDPVETLSRLAAALKPGGLMWLSTFFNDLEGRDPFHLHHNNKFQDTDLWFSEVARIGFVPVWKDPRGVTKGFIKK